VSIVAWGRRMHCDACGAQADVAGEFAQDRIWLDEPVPEGWTALGTFRPSVQFTDFYGGPISHLCDACSALPVGALVARVTERLRAQWEAERAKAGAR